MFKRKRKDDFDLNKDGVVEESEVNLVVRLEELEEKFYKAEHQAKLAWCAFWSMIVVTALLFSPFIPDSRIDQLTELFGMFYISMAGIVGAFMGVTAWMANSINRNRNYNQY